MTTYVVDGYNALFRLERRVPEDRDASRELLLRRVRAAVRVRGREDRVEVILDSRGGARAGMRGGDGPVAWGYVDGSADEAIVRRLSDGEHDPARTVVVTDDRELRGRVRQRGGSVLAVEDFFPDEPRPDAAAADGDGPGEPFSAADFGLPEGPIDLTEPGPPRRR